MEKYAARAIAYDPDAATTLRRRHDDKGDRDPAERVGFTSHVISHEYDKHPDLFAACEEAGYEQQSDDRACELCRSGSSPTTLAGADDQPEAGGYDRTDDTDAGTIRRISDHREPEPVDTASMGGGLIQ